MQKTYSKKDSKSPTPTAFLCQKRYWTQKDLKKYGYLKAKVREYDKVKIDQENQAKYEQFKEQKYASGEWQRPSKES